MTRSRLGTAFSPGKLLYHDRVRIDWKNGRNIYPVTLEIGVSGPGNCNNHCNFCMHGSYFNQRKSEYDVKAIMSMEMFTHLIDEVTSLEPFSGTDANTKGLIFSSSGEALTNPNIVEMIRYARGKGLELAFITNGSALLTVTGAIEAIVDNVAWTRTSLDAGTPETRKKVHGVGIDDYEKVLEGLRELVRLKKDRRSMCEIGAQIVVTPENWREIIPACGRVKETGADYFQIKPVVYHPADGKEQEPNEFWRKVEEIAVSAEQTYEDLAERRFRVIIKDDQFEAIMAPGHDRAAYPRCLANFFPIIEADGHVFYCSQTRGMPEFELGDLTRQTFREIWEGQRRRNVMESIDVKKCQPVCRCHADNKLLQEFLTGGKSPAFT